MSGPDQALARANAAIIAKAGKVARDQNMLSMWTIYDRPRDYPDGFIARCFVSGQGALHPMATHDVLTGELETIRESMMLCGLTCLTRDPSDHPSVLETWL